MITENLKYFVEEVKLSKAFAISLVNKKKKKELEKEFTPVRPR